MELKIAREGEWRPSVLGGSAGVSGDVLAGRDTEIGWEDVFAGEFGVPFTVSVVLGVGVRFREDGDTSCLGPSQLP